MKIGEKIPNKMMVQLLLQGLLESYEELCKGSTSLKHLQLKGISYLVSTRSSLITSHAKYTRRSISYSHDVTHKLCTNLQQLLKSTWWVTILIWWSRISIPTTKKGSSRMWFWKQLWTRRSCTNYATPYTLSTTMLHVW